MGTRSLTVFKDENNREICVMYRQFDGYPEKPGIGYELADFLDGYRIVNGIPVSKETPVKLANGLGCLAAQVVAKFKDGVGNVYLYPAGTRDVWEEFVYTIEDKNGRPYLTCEDAYKKKVIFEGTPAQFLKKYSGDVADDEDGFTQLSIFPDSSWIKGFIYDKNDCLLTLKTKSGSEYSYYNVPLTVWNKLVAAHNRSESVGSFYCKNIKGKYTENE